MSLLICIDLEYIGFHCWNEPICSYELEYVGGNWLSWVYLFAWNWYTYEVIDFNGLVYLYGIRIHRNYIVKWVCFFELKKLEYIRKLIHMVLSVCMNNWKCIKITMSIRLVCLYRTIIYRNLLSNDLVCLHEIGFPVDLFVCMNWIHMETKNIQIYLMKLQKSILYIYTDIIDHPAHFDHLLPFVVPLNQMCHYLSHKYMT